MEKPKKINRSRIAEATGLSTTHVYDIFHDPPRRRISIGSAQAFAGVTGADWTQYLKMDPADIEKELIETISAAG